jgi:hypothetical protein
MRNKLSYCLFGYNFQARVAYQQKMHIFCPKDAYLFLERYASFTLKLKAIRFGGTKNEMLASLKDQFSLFLNHSLKH